MKFAIQDHVLDTSNMIRVAVDDPYACAIYVSSDFQETFVARLVSPNGLTVEKASMQELELLVSRHDNALLRLALDAARSHAATSVSCAAAPARLTAT